MLDVEFTQHALERYMKRAKIRNVDKAIEGLLSLAEKVRPVTMEKFNHGNEVLVIRDGVITTYYKTTEGKTRQLNCARNIKVLDKILRPK